MKSVGLLVASFLVLTVLPSTIVAVAKTPSPADSALVSTSDGWIIVLDEDGSELNLNEFNISHSDSPPSVRIQSEATMKGNFTVLTNKSRLESLIPDPALAGQKFEVTSLEESDWLLVEVQLEDAFLDLTYAQFKPALDVPQYTLGSNSSIKLERPMFVSLTQVPHFENETRSGKNANGTFSYEIERWLLELAIDFEDTEGADHGVNGTGIQGQPVRIYSGWLSNMGFTKPYFVHEDGTPVVNSSLGSHWLLEPEHFSVIWVFSEDAEGFSKENYLTYSDASWSSYYRRIGIVSDRRDPDWANEMFRRDSSFVWDRTTSFTIRATWKTTQRGNWQEAIPLFFTASSNTNLNSPNTIRVYYYSMGDPLPYDPYYKLQYIDSSGTLHTLATEFAPANAQYFFAFEYNAYDGTLTLSMYDAYGVELASGAMTITSSNGFFLGKIGAASKGQGTSYYEPPTIGWTDSISFDMNHARNGDMELDSDLDGVPDRWDVVGSGSGSSQDSEFTFDASDEGFAKETDYPYSDVRWDSGNGRVYVKSNRRDAGDEMFTRGSETLDTDTDFTVTARWRATQQGNWQASFPIFLSEGSNSAANAANSVSIWYYSRDSNLGQNPRYYMLYRDTSATYRINEFYEAQVNTEYHFYINYEASTHGLMIEIRNIIDETLASASYTIGSNPSDGFTFGKIGVSSDGWSGSSEPVTIAWTDDITLSYQLGGGSSGTVSRDTFSYTNSYSVRITDDSDAASIGVESASDSGAQGGSGAYFRASAWVWVVSGTHQLHLKFWNSGMVLIGSVTTSTTTTGQWEYVEVISMAADTTAATGAMLFSDEANTGTAYWDAVELEMMREFWSINNHDGDAGSELDGWRKTFDHALDLGLSHVRTDLRWNEFHLDNDPPDWDDLEIAYWKQVIQMGKVRGIDLIAILNGPAPGWISGHGYTAFG